MKYLLPLFTALAISASAQQTKRVLFLGNSYTGVNNLPQMVANVTQSQGDSLVFDSNTPGGYTLNGHSTNATSQAKIAQGGWDYVVLQEQSQLPSFPYSQFSTQSLPYAITLGNQIKTADSCTKPLFYMTWGRKDGDQSNCANWPPVCTYLGMQALLRERYLQMADTVGGEASPVGAVWRDVRAAHPTIELYNADKSHPSLEGSYLAACTFYAAIFHKSPVGAAIPGLINPLDAQAIQQQTYATVFDSLGVWMIDTLKPQTSFVYTGISNCEIGFDASTSQNVDSVYWDFGDGTNGSGFQVSHQYTAGGTYSVLAEGWRGCAVDTTFETVIPCWGSVDEDQLNGINIYPNPATDRIDLEQYDQPLNHAHWQLHNTAGECILEGNGSSLNVFDLAAGIYVLEIKVDGKAARVKVVKADW